MAPGSSISVKCKAAVWEQVHQTKWKRDYRDKENSKHGDVIEREKSEAAIFFTENDTYG